MSSQLLNQRATEITRYATKLLFDLKFLILGFISSSWKVTFLNGGLNRNSSNRPSIGWYLGTKVPNHYRQLV